MSLPENQLHKVTLSFPLDPLFLQEIYSERWPFS